MIYFLFQSDLNIEVLLYIIMCCSNIINAVTIHCMIIIVYSKFFLTQRSGVKSDGLDNLLSLQIGLDSSFIEFLTVCISLIRDKTAIL